eukprot:5399254-Pleurochrysis_carterae.AAC.1
MSEDTLEETVNVTKAREIDRSRLSTLDVDFQEKLLAGERVGKTPVKIRWGSEVENKAVSRQALAGGLQCVYAARVRMTHDRRARVCVR